MPEASFWDTDDPYHYLRVDAHRGFDYAIYGGRDHKTGQEQNTADCFAALEQDALAILPQLDITHRWSGQVVETNDGLPYIGQTADRQYVATGFSGNGIRRSYTETGELANSRVGERVFNSPGHQVADSPTI